MVDVVRTETRYASGSPFREKWRLGRSGLLHRDGDLPAQILYRENGSTYLQGWYQNGRLHRDGDLPAQIENHVDGSIFYQDWYQNGQLHRDSDLPAQILYRENGSIYSQGWIKMVGITVMGISRSDRESCGSSAYLA